MAGLDPGCSNSPPPPTPTHSLLTVFRFCGGTPKHREDGEKVAHMRVNALCFNTQQSPKPPFRNPVNKSQATSMCI